MNDCVTERTPLVIAAEINTITHQTRKILLASAVEIGRRLKEAKSLLNHGEWGKWLEESVNYSRRTAERLMKLYEEYESSFLDEPGTSKASPMSHLTYTQALLLLGLPEEEREEFIAQNDVADMTTQELQQALKDRDQAKQEGERAFQENQVLKKGLELIGSTLTEIKKEQAKSFLPSENPGNVQGEEDSVGADSPVSSTAQTSNIPQANSTAQASNTPQPNDTPLPTHNLPTEIDPNAVAKYVGRCDNCCKTISTAFFELTTALTNLTYIDEEMKEEKRKEAQKLLETIAETIKEWPPAKKPLKIMR